MKLKTLKDIEQETIVSSNKKELTINICFSQDLRKEVIKRIKHLRGKYPKDLIKDESYIDGAIDALNELFNLNE